MDGETKPPKFIRPIKSITPDEGDAASFDGDVIGKPAPNIKWFRDDKEITADQGYQISFVKGHIKLHIPKCKPTDSGKFKCVAQNLCGTAVSTAQLVVKESGPEDESPCGFFSAIASSSPPPQEKKAPQVAPTKAAQEESKPPPQPSKTQPAAEAKPPQAKQPTEVKEEKVAAQQQRPEESKPPQKQKPVEKAPPPKAVEKKENVPPPQKQEPVQNQPPPKAEPAVKPVAQNLVQSKPPQQAEPTVKPAMQNAVQNAPPKTQPPAATKAVETPAQKPSNPGPVTNQEAKHVQNAAPVAAPKKQPKPEPPLFTKTLADCEVEEGKSIVLKCAIEANPAPTVTWLREGTKIEHSLDFQIEYKNGYATLTIPEAFVDDAGKFTCSAKNSAGERSVSCHLRVKELPVAQPPPKLQGGIQNGLVAEHEEEGFIPDPGLSQPGPDSAPQFVRVLQPQRYEEGWRAKFECRVTGKPAPTIVWLRHGIPIENGYRYTTRYDMMSGIAYFEITMVLEEDIGEYTCIAQNKLGQDSCAASIVPAAEFDRWKKDLAKQRAAEEEARAKEKRNVINRELDDTFKKEGPVTPSQQRARGRTYSAGSDEPVYYDPEEDGVVISPFEKRLAQEVKYRQKIDKPLLAPAPEPEYKKSSFESRLENEIQARTGKAPPPLRASSATFDVPTFEAQLLQSSPVPQGDGQTETETEMSEMDTDKDAAGAPRFTKELKNFKVPEGQSITFSARVAGSPKPKIRWYKDGCGIVQTARYDIRVTEGMCSLHIPVVFPEDSGAFTCFAASPKGKAVTTGRIMVTEIKGHQDPRHMRGVMKHRVKSEEQQYSIPAHDAIHSETTEKHFRPSFKEVPSDMVVKEGKIARLNCRVRGRPPPDLVWYRNDTIVRNDANHRLVINEGGMHSLIITYCRPEDAGVYTCVAKNRAGETKIRSNLTVEPKEQLEAPSFIERIENLQVNQGDPIVLSCKVTGKPIPEVSWQKDGRHLIAGTGRYTMDHSLDGVCNMYIEQSNRDDAAWYTCTAFNAAGRVACRAKVQVIATRKQQEVGPPIVIAGSRKPPRGHVSRAPTRQPTRPAYVKDEEYSDEESDAKSKPPHFVVAVNSMRRTEGERAHFACRVEPASDSSMRVEWLINGNVITPGSRIMTNYEFGICTLDINGVYPEDSGIITCRATNNSGTVETSGKLLAAGLDGVVSDSQLPEEMQGGIFAHIEKEDEILRGDATDLPAPQKIYEAPHFQIPLTDVKKKEGRDAHFACKVEPADDPRLRILWLRNGKPLVAGTRIQAKCEFGICSLDIKGLYAEDSGTITCRVMNDSGTVETECKLLCSGRGTTITESQLPQSMQDGIRETLEYDEYMRKEHPLTDYGAREEHEVYPAPKFTHGLNNLTIAEGSDAHFACKLEPSSDSNLEVEWLRNGRPIVAGSKYVQKFEFGIASMHIKSPYSEESGIITCRAKNRSGQHETQGKFVCKGKDTVMRQSQLPREMQVGIQRTLDMDEGRGLPAVNYADKEEEAFPAPKFIIDLNNCSIKEGTDAHFACKVEPSSDSNLEVEWLRNGVPLVAGSKYVQKLEFGVASMHIKGPYSEESGIITCRAKNRSGVDETQGEFQCKGKSTLITKSQLPQDMQAGIQRTLDMDEMQGAPTTTGIHNEPYEDFHEPPMFTIELNNVQVNEGHSAHFACRVEPAGDGSMRAEWYKDGRPVQSGSRVMTRFEFGVCVLDIKGARPEDEGIVTCKAKNSIGDAETNARLVVKPKSSVIYDSQLPDDMRAGIEKTIEFEEQAAAMHSEPVIYEEPPSKPEFITFPEPLCVVEGESARFTTRLSGHPVPRVLWFKDQDIMANGRRMKIWFDGIHYLDIPKTRPSDSGTIRVIGRNRHGVVRTETQLEVLRRDDPHIQLKPTHRGVKTGADPPDMPELKAVYDQRKGHYVPVPPDSTQNALYPSDVSSSDGAAKVQSPSPAHQQHHAQPPPVQHKPVQPAQAPQQHAQPVRQPAPQQQQQQQQRPPVQQQQRPPVQQAPQPQRQPPPAQQQQQPKPQPQQQPVRQQAPPQPQQLQVPPGKPEFLYKLEGTSAFVGEPARFSVRVQSNPEPQINWYKDHKKLPQSDRFKTLSDEGVHTLLILEARPEDAGVYHCEARNQFGSINCGARFVVEADTMSHGSPPSPPVIHAAFNDVDVYEGTPVEFICHISGTPAPNINWYLNDAIIKPSRYFMMMYQDGAARLLINEVFPEDEGVYKCEAINSEGRVACSAKLTVAGTPPGEDL